MSVYELMAKLGAAGIKLWVDDGQLKFKAPKGALTPDLKAELVENKAAVIEFLVQANSDSNQESSGIPAADRSQPLVLSHAQQRLWFIEQLSPGSSTFHIPATLILTGILDYQALEGAMLALIQRHESLRSCFLSSEGQPYQEVHQIEKFEIPIESLVDTDPGEQDAVLKQKVEKEVRRSFDLTQSPLIRARLFKLDDNKHGLVVTMHHIITDGWSMAVFVREISALYAAQRFGVDAPLPELTIQYPDYAAWQRNWLQGEELDRQIGYWQQQLSGAPEQLAMPFDRPRPPMQTLNGATVDVVIDARLSGALNSLAREMGTTLYVVLMAAYNVVLSKWSKQTDICVGMPVAGRSQSETENLIGFFVNTLVIRSQLQNNPTLLELIKATKEQVLGAQGHQDLPIDAVVEELSVARNLSFTPLYQTAFSLTSDDGSAKKAMVAGLEITPMPLELVSARLDLTLMLVNKTDAIEGMIEYNTDLFDKSTITKLIQHINHVLSCLVDNPEQRLDTLQLVSEGELQDQLEYPGDVECVLPLLPMQRDFCVDSLVNPDSKRNSIGYAVELPFKVDTKKWQSALEQVNSANPFLRSRVVSCDQPGLDALYQVIVPDASACFELVRWQGEPLTQENALDELSELALVNWDILERPLWRHVLVQCEDDRYWAVAAAHHCVSDGFSMRQHVEQVVSAYFDLPVESVSNASIQKWVDGRIALTDTRETINYWRTQFAGFEPVAFKRPDAGTLIAQNWKLSENEFNQLRCWCESNGISLPNYFRTLYTLCLQTSYFQNDPFVLINAVSGRNTTEDKWCGCAFQFVPYVQSNRELQSDSLLTLFSQTAANNRAWMKSIGQNQYLSLFARSQMLSRDGVEFQFNYRLPSATAPFTVANQQLQVISIQPDNAGTVKLLVTQGEADVNLRLSYHSNELSDANLLERIQQVHEKIMAGTDQLDAIEWLLPQEVNQLQQWGRGEQTDIAPGLAHRFSQAAQTQPQKVAVICGDTEVTYEQLNLTSNQVAHWINAQGVVPGDRIAICIGRSEWLPSVYLGAVKSPCAYVPLETGYPEGRINYILKDSAAKVLIADRQVINKLEANGGLNQLCQVYCIDDVLKDLHAHPTTEPAELPQDDQILYYVYTSGSTGNPKGAGVYYRGESNLLAWYGEHTQCAESDRVLLTSAIGFDLTQKNLFLPFLHGAALVVPDFDDYDPERLARLIDRHQVSIVNCAPSAFYPLLDSAMAGYPFPSLRHVVLGGEPIRVEEVSSWLDQQQVSAILTNSYGPTECSDVVACYSTGELSPQSRSLPVGKPIQNTRLNITDKNGRQMPPGAVGELRLSGDCVGAGYWQRPELTQSVFVNNPAGETEYLTGDLCQFDRQGNLRYVNRKDFQLKLRGLRIEPDEINQQLVSLTHVEDALTVVNDDRLYAYVLITQASKREQFNSEQALSTLKSTLPTFMVPAGVVVVSQWPLTPNGKIDRTRLPTPNQETQEFVAPRNQSEEVLADIWCQVLKLPQVSVMANFFELGGHSLLATQVVSRIRKALEVDISVRALFEAPTIEQLVHYISSSSKSGVVADAPPIQALDEPNRDTLSFAQYRLWFVDQLNQGSSEYNLPGAFKIKGSLDHGVLESVFLEIVQRHEVLRTNFDEADGVPKLIVRQQEAWSIPIEDVSHLSGASQEKAIERLVDQDAARVYLLQSDPLFTTSLIKLGEEEHILLLNMHHIISDGWSLGVMVSEIQTLYTAFKQGQSSPLPKLAIQYSDFAVWQRNWLQGEVLEQLTQYWKSALSGAPDVLRLPTDRPRPKHQTFNGAHLPIKMDEALSAGIKEFCAQQDLTPFMVLMASYHVLLSRYTQQKDICVGIPIAGRNHAEIEPLIGFFINGLVIRSKLDDNPTVLDYLAQVKESSLGAYAHQDMPADLLLDAIKMERTADTSPGAQVGFALQNIGQKPIDASMAGLTIEPVAREHKTAKYELSLILQEVDGCFSGVAEYNTDLFDASTIERMMGFYLDIVSKIIALPEQQLEQIQLLEPEYVADHLNIDTRHSQLKRLSPMQRDMYLDSLANPDTLKNSLGYHFITSGEFDPSLWQKALDRVVKDQPLLRSSIIPSDLPYADVAYLRVHNHKPMAVQFEDWSDRTTSDAQAADHARELIWQPYEMEGELAQCFVFRLDGNRHMVVYRMNHILLDGAGMAVHLTNCIRAAEAELGQGQYVPVEPVFEQYVEQAWSRFDSHEVIEYWKDRAKNLEALDFSMASEQVETSSRVEKHLSLSPQHWADIQRFCSQQRITPSLYFKAIYGLLINSYCRGETDFYVSEVVAGRAGPHRSAFGNYFQILPVVYSQDLFTKEGAVNGLFQYIRRYKKQLKSNAAISLFMQRQLLPQGRLHFMFNYYNFIPTVSVFGSSVQLTAYPQVQDGPVQFVVKEQDGQAELSLIYLSDLFSDHDFLQRAEHISRQIVSGTHTMGQLSLLLEQDQLQQTYAISPGVESPLEYETVVHGFEHQAALVSDSVAVSCGGDQLTYAELKQRSDQLARHLCDLGVKPGQRVAVCLGRSVHILVALLGVVKARAVYVPMDANYPEERLRFLMTDSEAGILVTESCVSSRIKTAIEADAVTLLDLDSSQWQADGGFDGPMPVGSDPLYAVYTSGSTGKPKGALVTHAGEMNLQNWYHSSLQLSGDDRLLLLSALGFDLTQKNIFAGLLCGAQLVIPAMDQFDLGTVQQTIQQREVTVVNCAPSVFYPLVEEANGATYPSLRYLVLGGEPINKELLSSWLSQSQCTLINSYGPTECTDVVAYHVCNRTEALDIASREIPIGGPICNTQLAVVDKCDRQLPVGLVGELCIAGAGVGLGYINRDSLNAVVFGPNPYGEGQGLDRWYRSGDLVRLNENKQIQYVGRKDFQIKLRGLRIELGEIDAALSALDGVKDCLTLVKDERLVSYVLAPSDLDLAKARKQLQQSVPDYMVPAAITVMDSWPLTANGKIDRQALPDPAESSKAEFVAPRNETEETLAQIWSEILGVENVGVHDSFFDLGGHSLLAARAVSKFRQAFDVDIQLRSLFELHTIAEIAQYVETMQWAAQSAQQAQDSAQSGPEEGREEGLL